jgi:hypothetical protein
MTPRLEAILDQVQMLSRSEQLELIRQLTLQVSTPLEVEGAKAKRKVTDLYGSMNCVRSGMNVKPR